MKILALQITDDQFARLDKIAKALQVAPEAIATANIFESLDNWGSWEDYAGGRAELIEFYSTAASRNEAGKRIEDEMPTIPQSA